MKFSLFLILFVFSNLACSSSEKLIVGEWEQFDTGLNVKYTYFLMNPDMSGVLATVRGKGVPNIDRIKPSQVKVHDGFIEIKFDPVNNYKAKLILSAYPIPLKAEEGLTTGMLYMYQKKNNTWMLFNTVFVRLTRIHGDSFSKSINDLHKELQKNK